MLSTSHAANALNNACVSELERLANPGHNLQRLARREFARSLQLAQVQPIHILHDEEVEWVGHVPNRFAPIHTPSSEAKRRK
jgi:hypothetical protein